MLRSHSVKISTLMNHLLSHNIPQRLPIANKLHWQKKFLSSATYNFLPLSNSTAVKLKRSDHSCEQNTNRAEHSKRKKIQPGVFILNAHLMDFWNMYKLPVLSKVLHIQERRRESFNSESFDIKNKINFDYTSGGFFHKLKKPNQKPQQHTGSSLA